MIKITAVIAAVSVISATPLLAQERTVGDRVREEQAAAITPALALRCIAIAGSHRLPDTAETESIRFGIWDAYERYVSAQVGGSGNVTDAAEPLRTRLDRSLTLQQILDEREACAQRLGATTRPPPSD